MTLNRDFALNSILCLYVWSSEAWLSKLGYSETCTAVNVVGELQTEKNSCGIAWFPFDSIAFLLSAGTLW